MERKVQARRAIQGVVVSDKNDKTIVVLVETHRKHAKYGNRDKYGKKFYAHDELNEAKVGDTGTIMETRKLSATKRFRLVSIDKKAVLSIKEAEAELKEEVVVEAKEEAPVAEESKVAVVEEAPAKKAASKKAEAEEEK
mgnify:CR=1 FL=1